ncbi:unnamed protein product [Bemisia tabaci]|uniref:Protein Wnt n=1 Tax=Bemisia tabaci TaxID=7038 RepID=A0A9P0G324_BEMTA|nr:unnamed protein product [Bemisia tabaci]
MRTLLLGLALLLQTWWVSGSEVVLEPMQLCRKTRRLKGRMGEICKKEPALLKEISRGYQLGTRECQFQFRNRRWNCTTAKKSLKKVLSRDTRESSFVSAITAAGVTYSVTRACTTGELIECSCDKTFKGEASRMGAEFGERSWEWGGCDDNINYGYRKSKIFMDTPYEQLSDISTLIKLHNNDAGRLAVKRLMITECKCHGLSGSCTVRSCWRRLPAFRAVGRSLRGRFEAASRVIPSNDGRHFIAAAGPSPGPGRGDLIYSEESPDFCKPNRVSGSLGTQGRPCNATASGPGSCQSLCCARGFDTRLVRQKRRCDCKFLWCCRVSCNTCITPRYLHTCR